MPPADAPIVIGLTMFFELLGAAVFVPTAQNIFSDRLLHNVAKFAPEVDPAAVLDHGAGKMSDAFDQSSAAVVQSFMLALRDAFALVLGCGGATFVMSVLIITNSSISRRGSSR